MPEGGPFSISLSPPHRFVGWLATTGRAAFPASSTQLTLSRLPAPLLAPCAQGRCIARIFLLRVTEELPVWAEQTQRSRLWCSTAEACQRVRAYYYYFIIVVVVVVADDDDVF